MNSRLPLLVIVCLLTITSFHCKGDVAGPEGSPSDVVFPASNVKFGVHVLPLFRQACNQSGCHDSGSHQSALSLTAFGDWDHLPGTVVPSDPENSQLVWRIEGRAGGNRMPLNTNPLNQNQINGIKKWIEEGALNN